MMTLNEYVTRAWEIAQVQCDWAQSWCEKHCESEFLVKAFAHTCEELISVRFGDHAVFFMSERDAAMFKLALP